MLHGARIETEQDEIPPYFWPVTGPWRMRGRESLVDHMFHLVLIADVVIYADLHKVFVDDESYNSGHGHAYEKYGVDIREGAIAIVRPDQCKLLVGILS